MPCRAQSSKLLHNWVLFTRLWASPSTGSRLVLPDLDQLS
jgi:hypothetical protein